MVVTYQSRILVPHQIEEIVRRYRDEGIGSTLLAREYSVSKGTIQNILRAHGFIRRTRGGHHSIKTINVPTNLSIIGYLAGLVDGEGSIVREHLRGNLRHSGVRLCITNSCPELLQWLKNEIGGNVQWRERSSPLSQKPCGVWRVGGYMDTYLLLKIILPWLRIPKKIEQAKEAITFLEVRLKEHERI